MTNATEGAEIKARKSERLLYERERKCPQTIRAKDQ